MTDFVRNEELQQHLQTPSLARMHWSVTCGWQLAEAMSDALNKHLRLRIAASPFWSVSLVEATAIDKTSWLCCHIYIIEDFKRVPVFVKLAQVTEAPSAENLLQLLQSSILGIIDGPGELASKLMGMGSDGASVLTGAYNCLMAKLRQYHAPFINAQHDAGHRTNLAAGVLDNHPLFVKLRGIVSSASTFFSRRYDAMWCDVWLCTHATGYTTHATCNHACDHSG